MENLNFEMPIAEKRNINSSKMENKIELTGPNERIFNATKKELGALFGFGLLSIEESNDAELVDEINRHFLENEGVMGNKVREWEAALGDINRDAKVVERTLADNFAKEIYRITTTESKIKDRYNN